MYLPYLRCKQFELLALREVMPVLSRSVVSPVLEPVKKSTGSLVRCLELAVQSSLNFTIIINPIYGQLVSEPKGITEMINSHLAEYDNFQFGVIVNQSTNFDDVTRLIASISYSRPIALVHLGRVSDIELLREWCEGYDIKYNLHGENFPARRYRGIIKRENSVLLDDKFRAQSKNADYLRVPDEFFSDDHIYYEEDGFAGFADFLTIGDDYTESGWSPYAVAIHFTYRRENGEIWIRHFVSDSNNDATDVAGKFGEALEKLVQFMDEKHITTRAAEEFRSLYLAGHYPGLGSLKKLSIMHHIELVYGLMT